MNKLLLSPMLAPWPARVCACFHGFIRAITTDSLSEIPAGTSQERRAVNAFSRRTHNCGELRPANIGEEVEIFGWLAFNRLNRFLVIRDSYGTVQAIVPESKTEEFRALLENLYAESAVRVKGTVLDRGPNRTKKMATGEVEVEIAELEVLNGAPPDLPTISSATATNESNEHTRLVHRYLDLRSERMQFNLRLRSRLSHAMRRFLVERCEFVEVETPTLSQWTPGGAAEFVVPAPAPNAGQFYTLPQSPQIYKQLLMCGGIDRYFQIARCYRNEGAKSNRQPEFTQVDMELSFCSQEDVINLVESVIVESWPDELAEFKPAVPFQRLSHKDAMSKYNSDKPDLRDSAKKKRQRRPFEFLWVVDFPLFTPKSTATGEGENSLESTHHPFTAPTPEHLDDLKAGRNLANIKAQHYDLVLNGVELGGGSIRIHDADLQRYVLQDVLKLHTDTLQHFLEALSYGAPPHGGFALGLDRYVALLAEECHRLANAKKSSKQLAEQNSPKNLGGANEYVASIRDVIAFPKSKTARCLMMGAPTALPRQVYDDYGISVVERGAKKVGDDRR